MATSEEHDTIDAWIAAVVQAMVDFPDAEFFWADDVSARVYQVSAYEGNDAVHHIRLPLSAKMGSNSNHKYLFESANGKEKLLKEVIPKILPVGVKDPPPTVWERLLDGPIV